jgi:hypothetical protein
MRTPCLTAASKAPAFSIKLRSLHVSPLSQKMTGIGEPLPALGSMTENFIVQPSTALACSYLPGADARSGFRGGVERCQVSALCLLWCCMSAPHCDRLLSAHSLVHAGAKRLLALLHSRHPVDPLQSHELGQWRKRGTVGHAHCACTQCYITLHHVALHHATSCRKARRQRYITLHHATSRSVTSRNHAERHAGTHKRVRPHADACAALFVGARCSIRWRTTSGAPLLALHLAPPTLNPEP